MKTAFRCLGLLILFLSACDTLNNNSATETAPTVIPVTDVPTEVPPTPTAVIANTLPPVQTIVIPSSTPAATRTVAATLTAAPTRTPDQINNVQLPEVPEEDETEESITTEDSFGEFESGPILQIRYGEITTRLSEVSIPLTTDTLAEDSIQITYGDTGPKLIFGIVQAIEEPPLEITADVVFRFVPEDGRLFVTLGTAYETDNPANAYEGSLLPVLEEELQKALDVVIVNSFEREMGDETPFLITGFAESPNSLSVETGIAE